MSRNVADILKLLHVKGYTLISPDDISYQKSNPDYGNCSGWFICNLPFGSNVGDTIYLIWRDTWKQELETIQWRRSNVKTK